MKKLFTLSIVLLGCLAAQAQTLYPGNITNLIARYDFNNTTSGAVSIVADVSGNANNSNAVNNLTTAADFRNVANKAVLFNGTNSYAFIPHAPILNAPTEVTMVALVRPDAFYTGLCQDTYILSKGKGGHTSGNYVMNFSDNSSNDCYTYDTTKYQLSSWYGEAYFQVIAGNFTPAHQWYFVASTYNGSQCNMYMVPMDPNLKLENITPIQSQPLSGPIGNNSDSLTLGTHNTTTWPYWFNGAMDEVAIFNRGLSHSEIYKIYSYLWGATLGVDNNELLSELRTYPNPAQNELTISGKFNGTNTVQLEVYNTIGQKVLAESIATNAGSIHHKVNTGNLPSGIYTAKLTAEGAAKTIRFSIQR